jgi:hypothetical protein
VTSFDPAKIARELAWLKDHPWFEQRPASIEEFLGEGFLDIEAKVRPGIRKALVDIFGTEPQGDRIAVVEEAMLTGAIGIGKTTFASIAIPYMVHWVLCLKDPQDYFELLPGSRIAFMQMSTSESQANEVVFGDIKARIEHCQWFVDHARFDPKWTKQLRFPKEIWVLPGDSAETTFEGYNILGGILDEADSHKVTANKDYAEDGYTTIQRRISSRFEHRGLIIVIGQMKKANGFAARKYKELIQAPRAYVVRMTIWESRGWQHYLGPDGERHSFWYDAHRKKIVPTGVVPLVTNKNIFEIPDVYRRDFENNPEKALRDLAGIPPATGDPFISLVDRIEECRDRWQRRYRDIGSPVTESCIDPRFEPWFKSLNSLKRVMHIDMAYSPNGDALGMAMGHVHEMVELEGELKPYIIFDMLLRMKAGSGQEIMFSDVRRRVYDLIDKKKFKIRKVTLDGFQSQDTIQQFRRRRIDADYLSVDRQKLPYEDLREAIYESRVEFPPYITLVKPGSTQSTEIAVDELSQLTDTGKKIDHPPDGSKDVADCMAAVVTTLMGDRQYHRGVISYSSGGASSGPGRERTPGEIHMEFDGLRAPQVPSGISGLAVPVPAHLRPRRERY